MTPDPGSYNPRGQAPAPSGDRLQLDPYTGPKSHHASRAFAEMVARRRMEQQRRKKRTLLLVGAVLGALFAFAAFRLVAGALGL